MGERRMLRYEVRVNDLPQVLPIEGPIAHVAASRIDVVEFWAEGTGDVNVEGRTFQVFGTGQPLPEGAVCRGTTDRTPEGLVWHLYELTGGAQ